MNVRKWAFLPEPTFSRGILFRESKVERAALQTGSLLRQKEHPITGAHKAGRMRLTLMVAPSPVKHTCGSRPENDKVNMSR